MRRPAPVLPPLPAFAILLLLPAAVVASAAQAATLVHNIRGYTMDRGERVEFVAMQYADGLITHLYRDAAEIPGSATELVDGGGATVLPGLIDVHGHVRRYGAVLASVDLTAAASEAQAVQRLQDFMAHRVSGGDAWVEGWGWNQELWADNAFPTRASLDAVAPETPVVLRRVDGHALWVNSAALAAAAIDAATPDPAGGQIVRDASGVPTGILVDNAMQLVAAAMAAPSVEQCEQDIERALTALAATGLTAVHDAGATATEHQAYRNLHASGRLPIRAHVMLSVLDPGNDPQLAAGPYRSGDGRLSVRSVKISADGALGSRGAALHGDYADAPGQRGLLLLSGEELVRHMQRAAAAGFQVNVHAIGDRANTLVLGEFERLGADPALRALRHRIEHAQVLRPADIARFRELEVIASIQPTHATSDKNMAGARLGSARLRGAYAWASLLASGARLAGGSDFPVEPPNPLFGLHAAVTREDRSGQPAGGWLPAEKLSRAQALSLFTEWAAYALFEEQRLGRLLPGYAADFVVLESDYFAQPEDVIWRNRVLATVVAGRVVHAVEGSPLPMH